MKSPFLVAESKIFTVPGRSRTGAPGLPGAPNPGLSGSNNSRMRSARFAHHRTTCLRPLEWEGVPWNHEKMWENHEKSPSVGHIFVQKRVAKNHHFSGCLTCLTIKKQGLTELTVFKHMNPPKQDDHWLVVPTHLKHDIMTSSRDRVAMWRSNWSKALSLRQKTGVTTILIWLVMSH